MLVSLRWYALCWCAFYNRPLENHIIILSKCISRPTDQRIHIKLVSSVVKCFWYFFARFNPLASINFEASSATICESCGVFTLTLTNIGPVNGTVGKYWDDRSMFAIVYELTSHSVECCLFCLFVCCLLFVVFVFVLFCYVLFCFLPLQCLNNMVSIYHAFNKTYLRL